MCKQEGKEGRKGGKMIVLYILDVLFRYSNKALIHFNFIKRRGGEAGEQGGEM